MGHKRIKKYDQNAMDTSNIGDMYDRHNDLRSSNIPPHFAHHPGHHHNGQNMQLSGMNGSNSLGGSGGGGNGFANNDQMSAMINMFNPMMAAFIQQLASQQNILPPNAQSAMDAHNNNAAAAMAALAHHPSSAPTGVPPPPWNSGNGQIPNNGGMPLSGLNSSGSGGGGYNPRFKGEKNF